MHGSFDNALELPYLLAYVLSKPPSLKNYMVKKVYRHKVDGMKCVETASKNAYERYGNRNDIIYHIAAAARYYLSKADCLDYIKQDGYLSGHDRLVNVVNSAYKGIE